MQLIISDLKDKYLNLKRRKVVNDKEINLKYETLASIDLVEKNSSKQINKRSYTKLKSKKGSHLYVDTQIFNRQENIHIQQY